MDIFGGKKFYMVNGTKIFARRIRRFERDWEKLYMKNNERVKLRVWEKLLKLLSLLLE